MSVGFEYKLLCYIQRGRNDEAKSMINRDLAQASDSFGTLLHHAARCGNPTIIRHLINLGGAINSQGRNGRTALAVAVGHQKIAAVKVLLGAGARIDIADADGQSPLQMTFHWRYNNSKIIRAFIHVVRTEASTTEDFIERLSVVGCTLHHSVLSRDLEVLQGILQRRPDVNSKDYQDKTALEVAAQINDLRSVRILIDNGANVGGRCNTTLPSAAYHQNLAMIQLLLEKGADPTIRNYSTYSLPLYMVYSSNEPVANVEKFNSGVAILLQHGALPQVPFEIGVLLKIAFQRKSEGADYIIAHLAMIGTPTIATIEGSSHVNNLSYQLKKKYELCQQILQIAVFEKLSFLDLLNASECDMKRYVRNETFVPKVKEVCFEHKLNELHFYYYDTLMKRTQRATRVIELEDKAISVICNIFNSNDSQLYLFAKQVIGYLHERDLERLCQV